MHRRTRPLPSHFMWGSFVPKTFDVSGKSWSQFSPLVVALGLSALFRDLLAVSSGPAPLTFCSVFLEEPPAPIPCKNYSEKS